MNTTKSIVVPAVDIPLDRLPLFRGNVDAVSGTLILGWCLRADAPLAPCQLEILLGGHVIGTTSTGRPRQDVARAFGADMAPGFAFDFANGTDEEASRIRAVIKEVRKADRSAHLEIDVRIKDSDLVLKKGTEITATAKWLGNVRRALQRTEKVDISPKPTQEILPKPTQEIVAADLTVVLGVHRSGTSMLTAGLQTLGLSLGEYDHSEDEHNKRGYFEHPEIRAFNERLMVHLHTTWDNWGFYSPAESLQDPQLACWRRDAAMLLIQCFPGPGRYANKDPRISTLWPFWQMVLNDLGWANRQILIIRHPDEVAESIRQRGERAGSEFPYIARPEPARALWAVTMHGLLTSLEGDQTLLVHHSSLYSDPIGVLNACSDFIGVVPDPALLDKYSTGFIDKTMRRATNSDPVTGGGWGDLARSLFDAFGPDTTPRIFTRIDADNILKSQIFLAAQLPYLTGIRESIENLHGFLR